ncbi:MULTISPECIES: acetate--CoA ligase family protein [unclassified Spirillospora]|uniref:acetate--CoA ligase family protein n=1 Tax=unclassified Spirillospora TaxID=2642701 RepID=UPI00371C41B2
MNDDRTGPDTGLGRVLAPRSVAVVGASPTRKGPATTVLANLRAAADPPATYAVNNRYADHDGFHPSVASLPEVPDVVVVAVPAKAVADVVREAADHGTRSFLVLSSGFAEAGEEGRAREAELKALALERGLTVLGPNSLGVFNFATGVHLTFGTVIGGHAPAVDEVGRAALIVQSGAIGSYLCGMAKPRTPFRYMFSTGNELVLPAGDLVAHLARDPGIDVLALYVEGTEDGRALLDAIALADSLGKRVVLLPAGESAGGSRAAASHTAAMASSNVLTRMLAANAGAFVADTPEELLGAVTVLLGHGEPRAPGVGIVSVSGGAGVITADRLSEAGLEIPEPAPETMERLRAALPGFVVPGNPTDTTAGAVYDASIMVGALEALDADPGLGQLITLMGAGGEHAAGLAEALIEAAPKLTKPNQLVWQACPENVKPVLAAGPVPVSPTLANAVGVAAVLRRSGPVQVVDAADDGPLPDLTGLTPDGTGFLTEAESRELLRAAGLPIASAAFIGPAGEQGFGPIPGVAFPVAVKLQATGVRHKTEIGGVVLDVRDEDELLAAVRATAATARERVPGIVIEGWTVEQMAPRGVEVLLSARHDPAYGPVVVAGSGGVQAELIGDLWAMAGPIGAPAARELLARTKVGHVLSGYRGRSTDLGPLCTLIARLSGLAARLPRIREIECNPVIVAGDGTATIADSLVKLAHS